MKKTQGTLRKVCIIVFTCSKKWIKVSEGDHLPLKNTSPVSSQPPVHSALTLMSNSSVLNMIQRWAHEKKKKTVASLVRVCLPPPDLLGYATPQALWEDTIHGFFPSVPDRGGFSCFGEHVYMDNSSGPLSGLSATVENLFLNLQ